MSQLKFINNNKKKEDNPKRIHTKNICGCKLNYFIVLLFLFLFCIFYKIHAENTEERNDVRRILKDNTALQEYVLKDKSKFGNKADMKALKRFFGIINEGRLNQFSCLSKPEKTVMLKFLDIRSEANEKLNPSSTLINQGISKTLLFIKDLDNFNLFLGLKR